MTRSTCCKSELVYITDGSGIKIDRNDLKSLDEIMNDKNVELKVQGKTFYYECGKCHCACDLSAMPDFTNAQIDWICYQIGDWYLQMKPLLEVQHNLGHMKEKLKLMICGDQRNENE